MNMETETDSMDAELLAFDTEWKTGDRTEARRKADAYVGSHPELAARYGALGIPELVALIDLAREQGDEAKRIEIDIWLLNAFEPQTIGGAADIGGARRNG